ncbi:hypothetical protein ElyMa_002932100, partial [Elysia marginata]
VVVVAVAVVPAAEVVAVIVVVVVVVALVAAVIAVVVVLVVVVVIAVVAVVAVVAAAEASQTTGLGAPSTGNNSTLSPSTSSSFTDLHEDIMDGGVAVEDFINTGRTGRRNAVADITDARVAGVSAAGMDFSFDQLSMADSKAGNSDGSKQPGGDSSDKSQAASKS